MTAKQQAQQIHAILTCNESAEMQPPFRCLPIGSSEWLAEKVRRIAALVQQAVQTTRGQDAEVVETYESDRLVQFENQRDKLTMFLYLKEIAAAIRVQEMQG